MADLMTQSWIKSFEGRPTAIARAGNVIGGGDVSIDRLIPDLINAFDNVKNENVLLYIHTSYPDAGWNLATHVKESSKPDKILFTYVCWKCGNYHLSNFSDVRKCCPV